MIIKASGENVKVTGRLLRVARIDGEKYRFLKDPEAMIEGLRNCGVRVDLLTFLQRLPETSPKYDYPFEWDNFATLPVSTFEHWWNQQIGKKTRNKARQVDKKGVALREVAFDDALVHGIWEIYNECPVRQGRPFPHYGKDLETVRAEAATFLDSSIFIGAFLADKLIGFIKLTSDETGTQAGLMHIVSMIQHRDKAPTNGLIAQAVRSCAERGIRFLVYSNYSYGNKQNDSLSDFKEHNGFQKVDIPRYYVPLTRVGSAAFSLGLHRRLIDHIPEALAARLRDLRYARYNHKLQPTAEV